MTTQTLAPSVNRAKLGRKLREARKRMSLTQRSAAEVLHWSLSKLVRIENGSVSVSVTDLRAMVEVYRIGDAAERAELEEAARGSRGSNWFTAYADVLTPQHGEYLGFETAADSLDLYHPVVIPGQFQTEAYARALLLPRRFGPRQLDRLVALDAARRERLFAGSEGARIRVVIDEAALRRRICSAAEMAEQMHHILKVCENPRVQVSVLPLSAGAHFGTTSPFVLLGFSDGSSDLLWVETPAGVLTARHDAGLLERYRMCLATIGPAALTGDEALSAVAAAEDDWRSR